MHIPRFFLITPSFNQAKFIQQTIDSVLNQKEISFKYVVMDGGSTDQTLKILKKYHDQPNFYFASKKDKGQSDAINKGIKYLNKFKPKPTDIFAYINSDDYYLPNSLPIVAKLFTQNPDKHWLVGDAKIINSLNREIQKPIRFYKKFWRLFLSKNLISFLNPVPQPATFIRYSALKETGLFNQNLRYTMDYEYWHRLLQTVGKPIVTSVPLATFRIHGRSKGGSQFGKQFSEELVVAQDFCKNTFIIKLHQIHNLFINLVYSVIK